MPLLRAAACPNVLSFNSLSLQSFFPLLLLFKVIYILVFSASSLFQASPSPSLRALPLACMCSSYTQQQDVNWLHVLRSIIVFTLLDAHVAFFIAKNLENFPLQVLHFSIFCRWLTGECGALVREKSEKWKSSLVIPKTRSYTWEGGDTERRKDVRYIEHLMENNYTKLKSEDFVISPRKTQKSGMKDAGRNV